MYLKMVIVFKIGKTCTGCKNFYKLIDFKKKDKIFKQCIKCRNSSIKSINKSKCIHNKIKYQCKECGGDAICLHHKQKYHCKECGGDGICQHNKQKDRCKDCNGSAICIHNSIKHYCKLCCSDIICQHNKQKYQCKLCNNPIDVTIKNMIHHSRRTDKYKNLFDELNFIDYSFVKNLIDNCDNKCHYCQCELQYTYYNHTLGTIERLNNNLGHIKSNCVIACKNCNCTKVGNSLK